MSIGVVLVILFFLILILVISTSFVLFHNQKKKQHIRTCNNNNQRKINIKHHLSPSAATSPSNLMSPPNLHPVPQVPQIVPPPTKQRPPDVVESPPPVAQRIPPAPPTSFVNPLPSDNYSDISATAEHYDLENASSIAPSDIDIVYRYKAYRNRDTSMHHRHAPLARLSPSVSELTAPRILTLQDLSPQSAVPPCPPPNMVSSLQKGNKSQLSAQMDLDSNADDDSNDDDNHTDDSFTCSEFDDTY